MEQHIYHGDFDSKDIARALIAEFNRGNLRAQQIGNRGDIVVQIATRQRPQSGGRTALSITLRQVEDGVAVQVGKQSWLGVAASLGQTALTAWRNPWGLLERLDDMAQDIEYIQLVEQVWNVIEDTARAEGATVELSKRLRRLVCEYCFTANPLGEPNCVACGAPLGRVQPRTCLKCGFVVKSSESICPNCGQLLM